MRRQVVNDQPTITNITLKLDSTVVELTKSSVRVDGREYVNVIVVIANALKGFDSMHVFPVRTNLPFSHSGILIYKSSSHVKVTAKHGLVAMWNEDDSFTVSMTSICKIAEVFFLQAISCICSF